MALAEIPPGERSLPHRTGTRTWNHSATLFTANAYDRENDFAEAAEWYERVIQLDPNVETSYR
jgi:tetratricopeptide (TPR) repeat protein